MQIEKSSWICFDSLPVLWFFSWWLVLKIASVAVCHSSCEWNEIYIFFATLIVRCQAKFSFLSSGFASTQYQSKREVFNLDLHISDKKWVIESRKWINETDEKLSVTVVDGKKLVTSHIS